MARIVAVCRSATRGPKVPVPQLQLVAGLGAQGDVHAGSGDRQISLLAEEAILGMRERGADVGPGSFGENIVTADTELLSLLDGCQLAVGQAQLELTKVGKHCPAPCMIFHTVGDCIMPRQGVFCRVIAGGAVAPGDLLSFPRSNAYHAGVLTISDTAAQGGREDLSGPRLLDLLRGAGLTTIRYAIVPDERQQIAAKLRSWSDDGSVDLILTTGGTGLAPRDVTPEATMDVVERAVTGLPEMIRAMTAVKTPRAYLSRGAAGIRGRTLTVNLPGSVKAVDECFASLASVLNHALETLTGVTARCGG